MYSDVVDSVLISVLVGVLTPMYDEPVGHFRTPFEKIPLAAYLEGCGPSQPRESPKRHRNPNSLIVPRLQTPDHSAAPRDRAPSRSLAISNESLAREFCGPSQPPKSPNTPICKRCIDPCIYTLT